MFPTRRIITSGGDIFRDQHSLVFDGTDEKISIYAAGDAGTVGSGTAADATYCFWAKSSTTAANKGVFGHGAIDQGAFHMNDTSSKPKLAFASDKYVFWVDNAAQDDNQWHHWVVVADISSMGDCKLYIDGILQTQDSNDDSGTAANYTTDLVIGNQGAAGNFWEGSMSDFAVYSTLLTATQVATIYNNREPYNHIEGRVASGSLVSWWRMGDGILDYRHKYGLVADQVTPTLGTEMASDGGFESGEDSWAAAANESSTPPEIESSDDRAYAGSKSLKVVQQGGQYGRAYKTFTTVADKVYRWSMATYKASSGQDEVYKIRVGDHSHTFEFANLSIATLDEWIVNTGYFIAIDNSSSLIIYPYNSSSGAHTAYVDSASMKLVNGNPGALVNFETADFTGDTP